MRQEIGLGLDMSRGGGRSGPSRAEESSDSVQHTLLLLYNGYSFF